MAENFIDVSLDDEHLGDWFPYFKSRVDPQTGDVVYDPPIDNGPRVRVRGLGPFYEARLAERKRRVEHVLNPKSGRMERISYLPELSFADAAKERDDSFDFAITGLEGFRDVKTKQELSCDRETKLKLMKIPEFDRFVARCLQIISEAGSSLCRVA